MEKGRILESWKAIAGHLRRNIRTCQLWEKDHGLPVHRLDGSPRARVFAYADELDRWLHDKLHERETAAGRSRAELPTLPRWNIGLIAGLAALAVAAVGTSAFLIDRQAKVRWAHDVAIPEIERLLLTNESKKVFDLTMKVEKLIPRSPRLAELLPLVCCSISVETDPPGARVWVKEYGAPEQSWTPIGPAPLKGHRLPQGFWDIKAEKEGFETYREAFFIYASQSPSYSIRLDRAGDIPAGMVHVRAGEFFPLFLHQTHLKRVRLADYCLDITEVTNRQFKAFVDAGGYRRPELWPSPLVVKGRTVGWSEAVGTFVDRTGRPGPATWSSGSYPAGQDEFPVAGVSWYEAAAYAAFAGKRLPAVLQWGRAAGNYYTDSAFILPASNFNGRGPAPVGSFKGQGPYGTYDMAGNVKEWCRNEVRGLRYCLGGSWEDDEYMFNHLDAYAPDRRDADIGFRCLKSLPGREDPAEIDGPIEEYAPPDFTRFRPCSDEVFAVYKGLFSYPPSDLRPRVESRQDWSESTVLEKVSFADATGEDRVSVYLFRPRRGTGPFQTVVYFPGSAAINLNSVYSYAVVQNREVDLYTARGRAFAIPVMSGTFERRAAYPPPETRERLRDLFIRRVRDFERCVDYLGTRGDIDGGRLAYLGLSWGANVGPVILALDRRFRAAVLLSGGMDLDDYRPERYSPETDPLNFAPRATTPTLIMNGRYDFLSPIKEESSVLLRLLGAAAPDKRQRIYETGHHVWQLNETRRDVFDWLDKYLGRPAATSREE